ncbi:hypothetical protein RD792_007657 [Penstemon davidsonii]|uniref:BAH domain-containing protein n=1 Tax=Penstemon davidsonii TaxID=160366 RepID=A0ABR0D711_9LAMI|nr:hypothetical protein RD792_007657 [Penstemon davidsonii]
MRPSENNSAPYVARVEKLEADNRNNLKVRVRWYYRPEESVGGRRQFHGAKELFLSDHFDTQSAHTIESKCIVHTFKNYTKLENVGPEDFYCRFEYKPASGAFIPDRVAVYCKCEMPYNPDDLMIQCEECKDWYDFCLTSFYVVKMYRSVDNELPLHRNKSRSNGKWRYHPACVDMTTEQAKQLDHFVCSEHSGDGDAKKPTSLANGKVKIYACCS